MQPRENGMAPRHDRIGSRSAPKIGGEEASEVSLVSAVFASELSRFEPRTIASPHKPRRLRAPITADCVQPAWQWTSTRPSRWVTLSEGRRSTCAGHSHT